MIARLRGYILDYEDTQVLIETEGGVSYNVTITEKDLKYLQSEQLQGERILFTHHHIREDGQKLYGFLGVGERMAFSKLITIKGVGPSVGMKVIDRFKDMDELIQTIAAGYVHLFVAIPGLGQKTAEKLIEEGRKLFGVNV